MERARGGALCFVDGRAWWLRWGDASQKLANDKELRDDARPRRRKRLEREEDDVSLLFKMGAQTG